MIRRRRFQARRSSQRGFTLIELMVSLVLFALVVTGMMAVAVSMISGYRDQEVTISTEAATRASIDFMTNALHNASTGVSTFDNLVNLNVGACTLGAIQILPTQVNPAPLTNTSDQITITFASGAVFTTTTGPYAGTAGAAIAVMDSTQIAVGDYVIVTNFENGHFIRVNATSNSTPGTITVDNPTCTGAGAKLPTGGYIAGATVIRAMRATFAIGVVPGDFGSNVPVLTMDADGEGPLGVEPIAEGIEDLQVVYGADNVTANGILDAETTTAGTDEWYGNVNGEVVPLPLPNSTRAIRITIVARTVRAFTGVNTFKLQAVEDRLANGATDNFRRRVLSTIVEIRNLQGSP